MNFQQYMQVVVDGEETDITFKNIVKLDGDYEVGVIDVIVDDTNYYDNNYRENETFDLKLHLTIPIDGLSGNERQNFRKTAYNTNNIGQLSSYDIWNLNTESRNTQTITIANMVGKFLSNPMKRFTRQEIIDTINSSFKNIDYKSFLTPMFRGLWVDYEKYTSQPSLTLINEMYHLDIPYYVSKIELSNWLAKLTGLQKVFIRNTVELPYAPLQDKSLTYRLLDPVKRLCSDYIKQQDLFLLIYCSLAEYQFFGNIKSPVLRIFGHSSKQKTINWTQFSKVQYLPIKFTQFQNFKISIFNEKGQRFKNRVYLTLHFKKKIKDGNK